MSKQTFHSFFLFKICQAGPAGELMGQPARSRLLWPLGARSLLAIHPFTHPHCCKVRIVMNHPVPFDIALKYAAGYTRTHWRTRTHSGCFRKHIDQHSIWGHLIIQPEHLFEISQHQNTALTLTSPAQDGDECPPCSPDKTFSENMFLESTFSYCTCTNLGRRLWEEMFLKRADYSL